MSELAQRLTAYRVQQESFINSFESFVSKISLDNVIVPAQAGYRMKNIGRYSLVPIFGDNLISTLITPGYGCKIPADITLDCEEPGGKPYLDAGLAIGLTYDNGLSAMSSARMTAKPEINIVQIQSVTLRSQQAATKYKTGLFNGILWRDTLVSCWKHIAVQAGVPVVTVQPADKNEWVADDPDMQKAFFKGYDLVAERLGFTLDTISGDWRLAVTAAALDVHQPRDLAVK